MSNSSAQGPEPVPHEAWYFIYTLVGILCVLIASWIIRTL